MDPVTLSVLQTGLGGFDLACGATTSVAVAGAVV
jgi:hypothetical protein